MVLSLDELLNIRDALNEKISALVAKGCAPDAKPGPLGRAVILAETRDKIQAEIDMRRNPQG